MGDTIFYRGKIKRTKTPAEVFAKIQKSIKKKGPTKNWTCTVDEEHECLCIDFHDDASEHFVLKFDGKEFNGFCKVAFPMEGELFEDGKSEFKALLDALYAVKSMFLKIEIFDDYGLAEAYWDNKKYKISFRELTAQEEERVRRLFDAGCKDYKRMLLAIIAEDMNISIDDLESNINPVVVSGDSFVERKTAAGKLVEVRDIIQPILETYIYETTEFQKMGRVCAIPGYEYAVSGAVPTSAMAFTCGVQELFENGFGADHDAADKFFPKLAQVRLLFREKFYPALLAESDALKKCILSYRFFVSVLDYAGFRYVGRMDEPRTVFDQIIERYGREKATIFLTCYCTVWKMSNPVLSEKYKQLLESNVVDIYGKDFWEEYQKFEKQYHLEIKFTNQVKYTVKFTSDYVDLLLIGM